MNEQLYLIGQCIIILLVGGLLSSLSFGLKSALVKTEMPAHKRSLTIQFVLGGLMLWLLLLAILSLQGFFSDFEQLPPRIMLAFIPPVVLIIFLLFSKDFKKILEQVPPAWLVYIQAFRILMELFLWLGYLGNYVPPQMTFEWLNFDIIVGITALMGGYVFFGRKRFHRFEAIIWNIFGIALLVNIVMIAVLSTPSPLRVFLNEPANTFVADVPFIWIPGFIVPFALAMHLFSLKQLIQAPRRKFNFRMKK
jgi:hypothetical protein